MKLVKINKFGTITTSIDGSIYIIDEVGIEVSDDIASKMSEQFLHEISVEDIAPSVVEKSPDESPAVTTE